MVWNWLTKPFVQKPRKVKNKAFDQVLQKMAQQAEAGEALLRTIRLVVMFSTPLFGLGAFASGVVVGVLNLEVSAVLEVICKSEADLFDGKKSAAAVADEMFELVYPEAKGRGVEELEAELLEERQFYYQLVKHCRNIDQ